MSFEGRCASQDRISDHLFSMFSLFSIRHCRMLCTRIFVPNALNDVETPFSFVKERKY